MLSESVRTLRMKLEAAFTHGVALDDATVMHLLLSLMHIEAAAKDLELPFVPIPWDRMAYHVTIDKNGELTSRSCRVGADIIPFPRKKL